MLMCLCYLIRFFAILEPCDYCAILSGVLITTVEVGYMDFLVRRMLVWNIPREFSYKGLESSDQGSKVLGVLHLVK